MISLSEKLRYLLSFFAVILFFIVQVVNTSTLKAEEIYNNIHLRKIDIIRDTLSEDFIANARNIKISDIDFDKTNIQRFIDDIHEFFCFKPTSTNSRANKIEIFDFPYSDNLTYLALKTRPVLYNINSFYNLSDILELNQHKVSIESDSVQNIEKGSKLNGNVILKTNQYLLNSNNVYAIKLDTINNDSGDNNFLVESGSDTKLRNAIGDYFYARYLVYNQEMNFAKIRDLQLFPEAFSGIKLSSKEVHIIENDDAKKVTMQHTIISLCQSSNEILELDRKFDYRYTTNIPKVNNNADDNKSFKELYDARYKTPVGLNVSSMYYNTKTKFLALWHTKLEAFGMPLFYIPYFTFYTGKEGTSGLLMPKFILQATRQIGFELPLYLKIASNIDLVVTRTQYFNTKEPNFRYNLPQYELLDLYRYRTSNTGFKFRHLLSTRNNFNSFYTFEGLVTDRSIMLDNATGLGLLNSNGGLVLGNRWFFKLFSALRLTKSTFLNVDWLWMSDKNMLYLYQMDFSFVKENKISLYDVSDKRYLSFELINYMPILYQFNQSASPEFLPVLRAEYEFNKDSIGGNFYTSANFSSINRKIGYNHLWFVFDVGYTLPYKTKSGIEITVDSLLRNQYDNYSYQAGTLATTSTNQFDKIYGTYYQLLSNSFYASNIGSNGSIYQPMLFNKIQAQKKIIIDSDYGTTIIEPKIALRYTPFRGITSLVPNDQSMGSLFTYSNAFSLIQTSGFGFYDSGLSTTYGSEVTHKFLNHNIEISTILAHNIRLYDPYNTINALPGYSSFNQTFSDIVGSTSLKVYNMMINVTYRYNTDHSYLREFTINSMYTTKYLILNVGYINVAPQGSITNVETKTINFGGTLIFPNIPSMIQYIQNASFSVNLFWNIGETATMFFQSSGNNGLMFASYKLDFEFRCLTLGFAVIQNFMTIGNIPQTITPRFNVGFKF